MDKHKLMLKKHLKNTTLKARENNDVYQIGFY